MKTINYNHDKAVCPKCGVENASLHADIAIQNEMIDGARKAASNLMIENDRLRTALESSLNAFRGCLLAADLRRGSAIRSKNKAMSDYWEGQREGAELMKSAILYGTTEKPSALHEYSTVGCLTVSGTSYYAWVRMEVVNDDIAGALDKAKPRKGETVLNTIPLP